jgi:hypothetical protein
MDNDVSQVIDRADLIENIINQIIHRYSSPRKEVFEFYWNVLLDSSILPLGSKIKVVMAIAQRLEFKINPESLHKVVSYRNAFAHHRTSAHPTIIVGKTPEEDEVKYMLQIIRQSGKTDRMSRGHALNDFNKHYKSAKEALVSLLAEVKNDSE